LLSLSDALSTVSLQHWNQISDLSYTTRLSMNGLSLSISNVGVSLLSLSDALSTVSLQHWNQISDLSYNTRLSLNLISNIIYNSLSTANVSVVSDVYIGRTLSVVGTVYCSNLSVLSNTFIGLNLSVASNIYAGNEIRASGDVIAFYNSSDFRLKKDVTNLDECVLENLVMKLRPVEFTWKDDIGYEPRRNTRDVGFIAQEIHEVLPMTYISMGGGDETNGPIRGIRHERIIPYLVKSIQQLKQEIEDLKNIVRTHDNKLNEQN
jgi:hypothetical protein